MIVTVPHGLCKENYNKKNHLCDLVAKSSGEYIYEGLKKGGIDVVLLIPEVTREAIDMNREISRNTKFRMEVNEAMKDKLILWDIHSYPAMKDPPFTNDVYILDNLKNPKNYSVDLCKRFKDEGFKCEIYVGKNNDITNLAREKGLISLLLEICEDLEKEEREKICSVFVDWVLKKYSGSSHIPSKRRKNL